MSIEITMPRLSDTMESGTVIKWTVNEGDEVSAGDAVADIETDKATMEMQVYDDGIIAGILVDEGQKVDVGTVIAVLAEEGEDPSEVRKSQSAQSNGAPSAEPAGNEAEQEGDPSEAADVAESAPSRAEPSTAVSEASTNGSGDGRMRISPVARRLADEHGLDLKDLKGSGPHGRIVKRDVLQYVEGGGATPTAVKQGGEEARPAAAPAVLEQRGRLEAGDQPLSNMRQTIAKRLVQSKTTIPHYQVTFAFNMDSLLELRTTLNRQLESQGVKLSVNDFLVRACALAIHQHPEFNAEWAEDHLTVKPSVNVGVAVALPREKGGGLVVATIRDADRKGLRQISEETRTLAEKARSRGLTLEEMADSTFTISNLGMFGVEHFTAIINPPNSAILAVGAAIEKPVVRDGEVVVGHEMQATLSLDHRIIDGAMAAQYLQTLKQLIENPATLLV